MAPTRYSRQRELVYEAVLRSREHPTAEMVYAQLKPSQPNLSLGTVYRNLNLLAQQGKLVRMPFPVERYDGDLRFHCHFCCERCGEVSDVDLPYDPALDALVGETGCRVRRHSTVFYGLCPHCAEAGEQDGPTE